MTMLKHEFLDLLFEARAVSLAEAQAKKAQLVLQLETVDDLLTGQQNSVKEMILASADLIDANEQRMAEIRQGPLLIQQNLLRQHQQQRSNSNVALVTVAKIAVHKQMLDRIQKDIEQIKVRIANEAKRATQSAKEKDHVQRQVTRTQGIIDLHIFLSLINLTPEGVFSEDVDRVFQLFNER